MQAANTFRGPKIKEKNARTTKLLIGGMFFLFAFCGFIFQNLWLRFAFAQFGAITPVTSIVIIVFMLGLGVGSWAGGSLINKTNIGGPVLSLYALIEIFISIGALIVPFLFSGGGNFLASVFILFLAIAMGMTYPIAVQCLHDLGSKNIRNFGFLYAANMAGSLLGSIITTFILIEVLGLGRTLLFAVMLNFLFGLIVLYFADKIKAQASSTLDSHSQADIKQTFLGSSSNKNTNLWILFMTGFCSMAMGSAWLRSFSVQLGPVVYSFATILVIYLFSNSLGAFFYRYDIGHNRVKSINFLTVAMAFTSTIPIFASCPAIYLHYFETVWRYWFPSYLENTALFILVPTSIALFSIVVGYLTPLLIDDLSNDDSAKVGFAYGVNIMGCIVGYFIASYLLVPFLGARISLVILTLSLLISAAANKMQRQAGIQNKTRSVLMIACAVALIIVCFNKGWEEGAQLPAQSQEAAVLHRDYAATSISTVIGENKALLVNGLNTTCICTAAKILAHLPIALHEGISKNVLVINLGMGSTFKSALSWDAKVTAIEPLPSIKEAFDCHYDNFGARHNPNGKIIIDDSRNFLRRGNEKFDIVTVGSPPPPEAATSSLLYSKEFYQLVKQHLNPGGILQELYDFPQVEPIILQGMIGSLKEVFPYIYIFQAAHVNDNNTDGWYVLASNDPIKLIGREEFLARMSNKAKKDLLELSQSKPAGKDIYDLVDAMFAHKVSVNSLLMPSKEIIITDDHPLNEYFWLRRHTGKQVYLPTLNLSSPAKIKGKPRLSPDKQTVL